MTVDVTRTPGGAIGWGYLFDHLSRVPSFHRPASEVDRLAGRPLRFDVTACGVGTRERERHGYRATILRRDHLARFGRPCRKCWPELGLEADKPRGRRR